LKGKTSRGTLADVGENAAEKFCTSELILLENVAGDPNSGALRGSSEISIEKPVLGARGLPPWQGNSRRDDYAVMRAKSGCAMGELFA
jgi:hypothetical protein